MIVLGRRQSTNQDFRLRHLVRGKKRTQPLVRDMVFSSPEFLFLFLPIFLATYVLGSSFRNATLLGASIIFYFLGEGYFIGVMAASVLVTYVTGRGIRSKSTTLRKIALASGIAFNILLLTFYKYVGFIATDILGLDESIWLNTIHLPIGISFFTFQSISYLIDVSRGQANKTTSFPDLFMYIAMFPQLIAGPIVRFASISEQINRRFISLRHVYFGLLFFSTGLAQKVLVADSAASVADPIFGSDPSTLSALAALVGVASYSLQIYFDFSGYSAMAIGLGLLLGFEFPQNFNFPYTATSVTDFWRKWHISLSSWFRDYVYIPLGGNRRGAQRTYLNLIAVFLLTGIWHGAAWSFVIWGLFHGTFLILERKLSQAKRWSVPQFLSWIYVLGVVGTGWIFFRAEDLDHALAVIQQIASLDPNGTSVGSFVSNESLLFMAIGILFCIPTSAKLISRWVATPLYGAWQQPHQTSRYLSGSILGALFFTAACIKVLAGSYSPFIYFRF